MGTFTSIQGKIDKLQKTVDTLLHMGENASCICVDDLALLNKEIHEQINDICIFIMVKQPSRKLLYVYLF